MIADLNGSANIATSATETYASDSLRFPENEFPIMDDLIDLMKTVTGAFREAEIHYAIIGGMAVRYCGMPRATYDLDFTILLDRSELPRLYEEFESLDLGIDPAYKAGWVDEVAGLPLVKCHCYFGSRMIDIDIFLAETEFQEQLMSRRRRALVEEQPFDIVSLEDPVLLKVIASREKDLYDIQDIRVMQPVFDLEYLREWAGRLGIGEQFEKVWVDSTPEESW